MMHAAAAALANHHLSTCQRKKGRSHVERNRTGSMPFLRACSQRSLQNSSSALVVTSFPDTVCATEDVLQREQNRQWRVSDCACSYSMRGGPVTHCDLLALLLYLSLTLEPLTRIVFDGLAPIRQPQPASGRPSWIWSHNSCG